MYDRFLWDSRICQLLLLVLLQVLRHTFRFGRCRYRVIAVAAAGRWIVREREKEMSWLLYARDDNNPVNTYRLGLSFPVWPILYPFAPWTDVTQHPRHASNPPSHPRWFASPIVSALTSATYDSSIFIIIIITTDVQILYVWSPSLTFPQSFWYSDGWRKANRSLWRDIGLK